MTKMDHARKELGLAIASLPPDAVFNIICYGDGVKEWKAGPVEATAANKAAAGNWIERIVPEGLT
ncbi:MAG: hypothetical protein JXQ29_08870, partial [Planctomycetes bacterium]|nr:hypothetical protein [Planctomycetota bacterium]